MKKLFTILTVFLVCTVPVLAQQNTAFSDTSSENEVKLYPNPAGNQLQVSIGNSTLSQPDLIVRSLIGNEVTIPVTKLSENHWRIDTSDLADGYYLLIIRDEKFNKAYKFVKKG